MADAYTVDFLNQYKIMEETYRDKPVRDKRAKVLRREGWQVRCSKVGFIDLARAVVYTIEARRGREKEGICSASDALSVGTSNT